MKARRAAVAFVLVTVTLDMLALGLIIPVLPKLILNFLGGRMASAAWWQGCFGGAFALMQFVFAPVLGVLSDRFGRRPIILASNLGLGVDYFVMALAPSIGWLFLGRIIAGITAASIRTSNGLHRRRGHAGKTSWRVWQDWRGFWYRLCARTGARRSAGKFRPTTPLSVAGLSSLTMEFTVTFSFPESLSSDGANRQNLPANPIGSLVLLRSHPELFRLATIQFTGYIAHEVFEISGALTIFRYAWSSGMVGLSLAIVALSSVAISRRTGSSLFVVSVNVVHFTWANFLAPSGCLWPAGWTGPVFMASIPIMMLWTIGPAAQGMMTHRVSEREQGALQGAIAKWRSVAVCSGRGCFVYVRVFYRAKHGLNTPGAPCFWRGRYFLWQCSSPRRSAAQAGDG